MSQPRDTRCEALRRPQVASRHPGLHRGCDSLGRDRVDNQRGPTVRGILPPLEDESGPWTGVLCRSGHPAVPNVSPWGFIGLERSDWPVAQRNASPRNHAAGHAFIMPVSRTIVRVTSAGGQRCVMVPHRRGNRRDGRYPM